MFTVVPGARPGSRLRKVVVSASSVANNLSLITRICLSCLIISNLNKRQSSLFPYILVYGYCTLPPVAPGRAIF
jgi:hypothetical protein